jgi:hypothetical protein
MSLYVLITGFGPPHWEHKLTLLENNLKTITAHPWTKCTIEIAQYASPRDYKIPTHLLDTYHATVHYAPGIVGEFIKRHAYQPEYDYILLLLDDVELINIDFPTALRYLKDFHLDVISPSLTSDSKYQYPYMQTEKINFDLKLTNVCEYFCMLFTIHGFLPYYNAITLDNPWMWGLDLILGKHLYMTVGIANHMHMKHWYKGESYQHQPDHNPYTQFLAYIARYNETPETLATQHAVRYYLYDALKPPSSP